MKLKNIKKKYYLWAFIIILLALIVLPTFTPEDFFTTALIISIFGLKGFSIIAIIAIILLFFALKNGKKKY